jgi:ankyrin repeat protein
MNRANGIACRSCLLATVILAAVAGCSGADQPGPPPQGSTPATSRPPRAATQEELDALLVAAGNAEEERVAQLLSEGLNVNQQNADGETALMQAAANGHNGYVETLMTVHKADPALRNKAGKTADLIAWENGHAETAGVISDRLIQTKSADRKFDELLAAAANADSDQIGYLVKRGGVDINRQNADGETALMQAAANGHNGFVVTLITRHKADPLLRNKAGKTAEEIARKKVHDATADAIARHRQ